LQTFFPFFEWAFLSSQAAFYSTSFFRSIVTMPYKPLTRAEVAKNNTEDSLWFIIDSKVYDVTDFKDAHPGGEAVLKQGKVRA
jgi:cytochrome b involved in lipid metabolism